MDSEETSTTEDEESEQTEEDCEKAEEACEHKEEAGEQAEEAVELGEEAAEHAKVTEQEEEAAEQAEVAEQAEENSAHGDIESEEDQPSPTNRSIKIQGRKKKRNICLYCQKPQTMFARHVFRKHKTEMEVCQALSYPAKSDERRNVLANLIHRGNYRHNAEVVRTGHGTIIPGRCPVKSLDAT